MAPPLGRIRRNLPAIIASWLAIGLALSGAAGAQPCSLSKPCTTADGAYAAKEPAGWDGQTALPLLLFLHGYRGSSAGTLNDPAIATVASEAGMLLVAPQGRDGSWSHVGSPSQTRDDVAFLRDVVDAVKQRWPIDPGMVVAAGFSQGGSMVWDLACRGSTGFTAFLPIAGGFWDPLPAHCLAGPVILRHVHGTADAVVPMAGRAIRGIYRQGDIGHGMAIWRRANRCAERPDRGETIDSLTCETWGSCERGRLQLCLHRGGHDLEAGWLADGLAWIKNPGRVVQ